MPNYNSVQPQYKSILDQYFKPIANLLVAGAVVVSFTLACSASAQSPSDDNNNQNNNQSNVTSLEQKVQPTPTLVPSPSIDSVAASGGSYDGQASGKDNYVPIKIPTNEEIRNATPGDIKRWTRTALEEAYAARSGSKFDERRYKWSEDLYKWTMVALLENNPNNYKFEEKYLAYIEAMVEWAYGGNIPPDVYPIVVENAKKGAREVANHDTSENFAVFLYPGNIYNSLHRDPGSALEKENK